MENVQYIVEGKHDNNHTCFCSEDMMSIKNMDTSECRGRSDGCRKYCTHRGRTTVPLDAVDNPQADLVSCGRH